MIYLSWPLWFPGLWANLATGLRTLSGQIRTEGAVIGLSITASVQRKQYISVLLVRNTMAGLWGSYIDYVIADRAGGSA